MSYQRVAEYATQRYSTSLVQLNPIFMIYGNTKISTQQRFCDLLAQNVVAIISMGTSDQVAIEADLVSSLNIPLISVAATNPFLKANSRNTLLRMSPPDSFQGYAIYQLLKHFKWNEFSMLMSSDNFGINGVLELENRAYHDAAMSIESKQYFIESDEGLDLSKQLNSIKEAGTSVIILNCQISHAYEVFKQAKKDKMLEKGYVWIVTNAITSDLRLDGYIDYSGLIGIIGSVTLSNEYYKLVAEYSSDSRNPNDLSIFAAMLYDAVKVVREAISVTSTIDTPPGSCQNEIKWQDGSQLLKNMLKVQFEGITGPIGFQDDGLTINQEYDIKNFFRHEFTKIGSWKIDTGLEMLHVPITFIGGTFQPPKSLINSLNGKVIRIGTIEGTFVYRRKTPVCKNSTKPSCWYGLFIDLNNRLAKDLNFTYELIPSPDGKFGNYDEDLGRFTGLVYELEQRRIDVAAVGLTVNSERMKVIDFLTHIFDVRYVGTYVPQKASQSNIWFFVRPFYYDVWVMIPVIIVIAGIVITIINLLSPIQRLSGQNNKSLLSSFFTMIFLVTSGLVGREGGDTLPKSPSAKFVLVIWWFFTTIFISIYTANLTAYVTLNHASHNIDELTDLLNQDYYKWGVLSGSSHETAIRTHQKYRRLSESWETVENKSFAMDRLATGRYFFISEDISIIKHKEKFCNLSQIYPDDISGTSWAYGIPKKAPYKSILDRQLLKYREEDYLEELKKIWISDTKERCNMKVGSDTSLSLAVLSGLLSVLSVGGGIGLLLLIMEYIYLFVRKRSRIKQLGSITNVKRHSSSELNNLSQLMATLPDNVDVK